MMYNYMLLMLTSYTHGVMEQIMLLDEGMITLIKVVLIVIQKLLDYLQLIFTKVE